MKKIHKITNIALIFTLIGVFFCQGFVYSTDLLCLRVPMAVEEDRMVRFFRELEERESKECLYLAYEAILFKKFFDSLKSKQKIIVANESWGTLALAPINIVLEKEKVDIVTARISSSSADWEPDGLDIDIFSNEILCRLIKEQPTIVIVDASDSISEEWLKEGIQPHYPAAHKWYRNYFIALNEALGFNVNAKDFFIDEKVLGSLRQSSAYLALVEKIKKIIANTKVSHIKPYHMGFWTPAHAKLDVRSGIKAKDGPNAIIPSTLQPQEVAEPMLIIVQSEMTHEDIVRNAKDGDEMAKRVLSNSGSYKHNPKFFDGFPISRRSSNFLITAQKACAIVDLFNPQDKSVHNVPLLRSEEAAELQNLVKFVANDIFEQDLYKRLAQLLGLRNTVIEVGQGGNLLASRGLKAAGVGEVITLNAYDSSNNHVDAATDSGWGWIGYSGITAECADAVVFNGSLSHVVTNPLSESAKWVTNPAERNMRMLQTLTNALEALKSDGWLVITSVEFSPSTSIKNRMLQQVDGAEVLSILKKLGCDRVEIVRSYAPIDFTTRTDIISHLLLLAKKPPSLLHIDLSQIEIISIIKNMFHDTDAISFADLDTATGEFVTNFSNLLKKYYKDVDGIGVELLQQLVDKAKKNGRNVVHGTPEVEGDYEKAGLLDNSRDIVTINNIESRPLDLIAQTDRILKKNGLIIVTFEKYDIQLETAPDHLIEDELNKRGYNTKRIPFPEDYPHTVSDRYSEADFILVAWRGEFGILDKLDRYNKINNIAGTSL